METESQVSYLDIKNEIEKQLKLLKQDSQRVQVSYQKEEFQLELKLPELDEAAYMKVMLLGKRHIENWRIHTFEDGYLSLQALNKNLFESEGLLSNLKIRLSGIYGDKVLEITKRKPLNHSELSLIIELLKYFLGKKKSLNPLERIREAGCQVYLPESQLLSFEHMGGYTEVKAQAKEAILLPLQNSEIIEKIAQATRKSHDSIYPKAVLFSGPPGVGKTTMARIVAKEAGFPLVYIPIESIMSAYYGESSKRLALIFDMAFLLADKGEKLILFLDEIDALAPSRSEKLFEATRRLLSVLLRKIDGIESRPNCLTIGATNRKDDLDQALLSRFDTVIEFPYPSETDITHILSLYAKHLSHEEKKALTRELSHQPPRFIQDVCKKSERNHAARLIEAGTSKITPPPVDTYLQTIALSKK